MKKRKWNWLALVTAMMARGCGHFYFIIYSCGHFYFIIYSKYSEKVLG